MSDRNYWKVSTIYKFHIMVFDGSTAKTGLTTGNFTKKLAKNDVNSAVTVTVTEVDSSNFPGLYVVDYTPDSTEDAVWACWVAHSTYNPLGWLDEIETLPTTMGEFTRLLRAYAGGKVSGQATSPVYRDPADTKNVISATVDSSGNRSAVTLSLTP